MCMILFAYDAHPGYKLIVAANRDEDYSRPTAPAAFWGQDSLILAGKDLEQGGTWMGITKGGRYAAITNYRDPSFKRARPLSRGRIVREYLECDIPTQLFMEKVLREGERYNGFNLLAGTENEIYCCSNRESIVRKVEKGVHGLSNSLLDVPWPKVSEGIAGLKGCLCEREINIDCLFNMLASQKKADDHLLPETGVGLEFERMLSPIFIAGSDYGTRSSTVLLIDRSGYVNFWERSFFPQSPNIWSGISYEFIIDNS